MKYKTCHLERKEYQLTQLQLLKLSLNTHIYSIFITVSNELNNYCSYAQYYV